MSGHKKEKKKQENWSNDDLQHHSLVEIPGEVIDRLEEVLQSEEGQNILKDISSETVIKSDKSKSVGARVTTRSALQLQKAAEVVEKTELKPTRRSTRVQEIEQRQISKRIRAENSKKEKEVINNLKKKSIAIKDAKIQLTSEDESSPKKKIDYE